MKHVLVTNGKWLHNVYTIEKGKEWMAKHPNRKDVYIKADRQWYYKSDAEPYTSLLDYDEPDLVGAIKANAAQILKKAGFRGTIQISSMQLEPGERQISMYRAVLTITACPVMPRMMRIGNKTIVQNLVDARRKETHTVLFSNVTKEEYDRKPVRIHLFSRFVIE